MPPFYVWMWGSGGLSLLVFLISWIYKGLFTPNIRDSVDAQKGYNSCFIALFTQSDACTDAWKWLPDPFQVSTLVSSLTLTLSVNMP